LYTNDTTKSSSIVDNSFLTFAARHGLALLKLRIGSKVPVGEAWLNLSSTDPIEWAQWKALNFNIGVHARMSRLVIVDPDAADGKNGLQNWDTWCRSKGLNPDDYPAHVTSARGGRHIYFRVPEGITVSGANERIQDVDIIVNGQTVAPGSYFDGTAEGKQSGWYTTLSDTPPHPMPAALIALCTRKPRKEAGPGSGDFSFADMDRRCTYLAEVDGLSDEFEWIKGVWALRRAFGDAGWPLAEKISYADGKDRLGSTWAREDSNKENPQTCATLIKLSNDLGYREWYREHMFDGVVAQIAAAAGATLLPPLPYGPLAPAGAPPLPEHGYLTAPQADILVKYWAHLPTGRIIYEPTGELYTAGSFDKHIGRVKDAMKTEGPGQMASTFLSQHRFVRSLGWAPGKPKIVKDRTLTIDGWIHTPGDNTFNRYLPPDIEHIEGDVSKWLNHIRFIYPNECEHIVNWLAHRVQRPGDKVNHALVFIGEQGIGKDTIVTPVIAAIGSQNFKQITAKVFYNSEWNDYLQSVILRINEVHDLGGESRYGFYDATKDVITSPPETHRINTKHVPQYAAVNVCGAVLTSNHLDAIYVPPGDRRHYVCSSTRTKEEFPPGYFDEMHAWFENGGNKAVAHLLANLDLSAFNAKSPPPKTAGWFQLVANGLAPETGDLEDVIEAMGKPAALTIGMIKSRSLHDSDLRSLFEDAKLRRAIPKRLGDVGYTAIGNPDTRDGNGRWRMPGGKTTIYVRKELSETEKLAAARLLVVTASMPPPPPTP